MRKRILGVAVAGAALALMSPALHAQTVTLMSDDLLGTSGTPLAGTSPDVGSGTWSTTYTDNGGEIVPATQTDSTGAGWPAPATTGILPVDPSLSPSPTGVNVGAYTSHTDDSAYIPISPAATGLITGTDTFSFSNIATSGNPTAWGFLALITSLTSPDVIQNTASVGPWALVRPKSNGTDVVEIYATGGTGHQVTTTNVETNAGVANTPHIIQLQFDPSAGTLDATVDGVELLSTPYSYSAHSVAIPVIDGVMFGNRTNTGQASSTNPSTTNFTAISVVQAVPEPASVGVLGLGGLLAMRRRRRA
jgi:hypothetical protein